MTHSRQARAKIALMFLRIRLAAILLGGMILGSLGTTFLSAQLQNQTTELIRTDLAGCDGKEVVATVQSYVPGESGMHSHSGSSFTYVLEGSETWQADGKPAITMKAGDFIYDEPNRFHRTMNAGPMKLLILRVLDKGRPPTVRQ